MRIIISYFTDYALSIQDNKICLTSSKMKMHRIVETLNITNKFYGKERELVNQGASNSSNFSVRSLYTYLQNKRMRRCGVPPPPTNNFRKT